MTGSEALLRQLPRHIDISCVQAFHGRADIEQLVADARRHSFVSAHVLPQWVPLARKLLAGSDTLVGAPVGFPSGGATLRTKVGEATELVQLGVQELDVVVSVGRLRSGEDRYVEEELRAVRDVVPDRIPLRAILEVGHLTDDEIRRGADIAIAAGVPWLKTATGWSGIPTSLHHVEVLAAQVAGRAAVKAAGGIRDVDTIRAMADLGVTRFGMNARAAVAAVAQLASQHAGQEAASLPAATASGAADRPSAATGSDRG